MTKTTTGGRHVRMVCGCVSMIYRHLCRTRTPCFKTTQPFRAMEATRLALRRPDVLSACGLWRPLGGSEDRDEEWRTEDVDGRSGATRAARTRASRLAACGASLL